MKNATGLQRTSYRARHARCVSAWTATFAWPRIVDVLPASFTASGIPHRCACHCQRKIQRKMSRTEHKTASAHCHEHQLKFSCSFSIFDNAFYGSSCTGIWYKVWRNIWKYGGTSHDDNQQAEANPSSAETKKQITIDLRNDSVQNVSWCMLISDRHHSHFGSRYHTRADAATQAFFSSAWLFNSQVDDINASQAKQVVRCASKFFTPWKKQFQALELSPCPSDDIRNVHDIFGCQWQMPWPRIELGTSRSSVWRSPNWAIAAMF